MSLQTTAKIVVVIFHLQKLGTMTRIPHYAVPHFDTAQTLCKHTAQHSSFLALISYLSCAAATTSNSSVFQHSQHLLLCQAIF